MYNRLIFIADLPVSVIQFTHTIIKIYLSGQNVGKKIYKKIIPTRYPKANSQTNQCYLYLSGVSLVLQEKFEDVKGTIRTRKSKGVHYNRENKDSRKDIQLSTKHRETRKLSIV